MKSWKYCEDYQNATEIQSEQLLLEKMASVDLLDVLATNLQFV